MAVLTPPPRTRPRFGPQAGLVAATRGVAFAALMAAGIGLLIMIVAAVFLIALGAAILIVGHGGPHEERVLLGFLAIGSGLQTWVDIRHTDGMLRIGVTDNGHGGAEPARGTGLRGIERRLAAFDGVLAISSPPGGPTAVTMEIPCALSSPKTSSC
jgi:hypothetical protein